MEENTKLGIALSGGGARGIAHIGVLQALEESGISPQFVSGTSAGSLVGFLYAAGLTPLEMLDVAQHTNLFKVFRLQLRMGLIDLTSITQILAEYLPENTFEALTRRLFVCVTNLERGKWEIHHEGELFPSIVASCSIPLIFKPIEINGELYADGGVLNNLPVEPLRIYAHKIIGVNVIPVSRESDLGGFLEIVERSIDLVVHQNADARLAQCDVALTIDGVEEYKLFDFNKATEIYQLGYDHTIAQIDRIKRRLRDE